MAFVVARPGGRFEVRESRVTPHGPRARTLATFGTLDDAVVAHVIERAESPIDVPTSSMPRGGPVRRSRWARHRLTPQPARCSPRSAPVTGPHPRSRPRSPKPSTPTSRSPTPYAPRPAWSGATPEERGDALRDLLLLADRLPVPARRR